MSDRNLDDLHPAIEPLCKQHIAACAAQGIDLLVTCTYRSPEDQAALYAQGRTAPGAIVTNAKPGQSMHQYKLAYDVVPIRNGKPVWASTDPVWKIVGAVGVGLGLEWGGQWTSFVEFPHFQLTGGHPLSYFEGGGTL